MKLEQAFDVKAPVETVWETLIDVERVAPCLPGAEITGSENGVYQGNFQVKIGPTTAAYRGQLEMESLDEAARIATMKARGQDKRGQGSANATIVSKLSETPDGGTHVEVVTDFTITGTLARFGRGGMMQDIANRLLRDFATCLEKRIGAGEEVVAAVAPVAAAAGAAMAAAPAEGAAAAAEPAPAAPATPPAQEAAPPVKGISLFFSVLWERIKRFFSRK
jgi:carbon monoxide dehydrogenase subunit G